MNNEQRKVRNFHRKFGLPIGVDLMDQELIEPQQLLTRASLIQEEAAEFTAACREGDQIEMADALADILYVTYAAAVVMGIDLQEVFNEVHRSNMSKTSVTTRGGKITKGADYQPPEIMEVLKQQLPDIYFVQECLDDMGTG